MISWDHWRNNYDDFSYEDQLKYYDEIYGQFPKQNYCTITYADLFFRKISVHQKPIKILEIGGWDGTVADYMLKIFSWIGHWTNYEICQSAISNGLVHSARYMSIVPKTFIWDMEEIPETDVFFAAHTIEHMKAAQAELLFSRLNKVKWMYLEVPIPESSTDTSWLGYCGTHILEIGWEQLEEMLKSFGFHVTWSSGHIRFLER